MASFFRPHSHYYSAEPNFQGLFRLIDDFDKYSSQNSGSGSRQGARNVVPTFTPKFDMKETETAYELHGELPGMSKDDVHIEFTDPQTLLVRGRVERTYTSGTPPAGLLEGSSETSGGALEDGVVVDHADSHPDNKSHKATVEDDPEEKASNAATETPQDTPATTVAEPDRSSEQQVQKHQQQQQQEQQAAPKHKFYLVERNVGTFSRSFHFPGRVDNESVQASLNDGILTITVQKAKKHESRRITVN